MPKSTTPKWAVVRTLREYSLHAKKDAALVALALWCAAQESLGLVVKGSKSRGSYTAYEPDGPAKASAGIIKLADHPVCYIGLVSSDIPRLRAMEEAGNPDFERYSARAKEISAEWRQVEAL